MKFVYGGLKKQSNKKIASWNSDQSGIKHFLDFSNQWPNSPMNTSNENPNPNKSKNRTYSNQWAIHDNEEQYDSAVTNGVKQTYKKDDFYYDINSRGFRCDEFDRMDFTKKSIIYLGCSHTYGIGLPEEHCWPTITHNKIQEEHNTTYNYINLGVHGVGLDYYLHFLPYFNLFNPEMVLSATPEITRMNMVEGDVLAHLTSFQVLNEKFIKDFDYKLTPVEDDYKNLVLRGDGYFEYKKEVIFANIKAVTKLLNSKFIEMDSEILVKHWKYLLNEGSTEISRDNGQHPTKSAHEKFSELMMAKIKGTK